MAAVAAIMLGGATAQAGFISGGVSFSATTQDASSGTALSTRNITNVLKTSGSSDFNQALNLSTNWSDFALTDPMPAGGAFSLFNASFGAFTSTALLSDTRDNSILVPGNGSRTITYKGAFAAGSLFSAGVRDVTEADLNITLNQSTTGGNTFFSSTVTMTAFGQAPVAVPEPTSMAIFGLGALGLVTRRFRRK